MMTLKSICRAVLFLSFIPSFSYGLVGVGSFFPFAGDMDPPPVVKTNESSIHPTLYFHHPFFTSENHYFLPNVGLVFHNNEGLKYKRTAFFALFHLRWMMSKTVHINYGLGTFFGDFSTFYRPTDLDFSNNTTLDFGVEIRLTPHLFIGLTGFMFEFLSSDERAQSFLISLNFYPKAFSNPSRAFGKTLVFESE